MTLHLQIKLKVKVTADKIEEMVKKELNPGVSMYHRGLKKLKQKSERLNSLRKENEKNIKKACTFRPNINAISKGISKQESQSVRIEDRLIDFKKDKQEKVTPNSIWKKRMAEC